MVKRVKTPPPSDDEPKYLTVVHPYPPHGNWELPKDCIDFALWLACCIGKDSFYAFFHKPSAPDMVIVEIARDFPAFDRVLGEHRWSEFLKNPSDADKNRTTKVFYCKHSTGREVQKQGWKLIHLDDAWFDGWSPHNNKYIQYPYPATRYCELPREDRTNAPLCRPLPKPKFTPPPAIPPPVVGSPEWVSSKKTGAPFRPTGNAWARGKPASIVIPTTTRGRGGKTSASAVPAVPSPGTGADAVARPDPWTSDLPSVYEASSATPSSFSWNSPVCSAPSPLTSPPAPNVSPVARMNPGAPSFFPLAPPGLSRLTSTYAEPGVGTNGGDQPRMVHIENVRGMEDVFSGLTFDGNEDEDEDEDVDFITGPDLSGWGVEPVEPANELEQEWVRYAEPEKVPPKILCKSHGIICKKGICQQYAEQLREAAREERLKNEAAEDGKGRGKGKGKGKGQRKFRGVDEERFNARNTVNHSRHWRRTLPDYDEKDISSSGYETNTTSAPADEDESSVASSGGRARSRRMSNASTAASTTGGWGNVSTGPY